jgi:hypothetical protein
MNPLPEVKTVDLIALITRTYRVSENEALRMMQRALYEKEVRR